MHLRLNVPDWTGAEIGGGAAALLLPGRGARERARLVEALRGHAPGWRPHLVASARAGIARAAEHLGLRGRPVAVPGVLCPAVLSGLSAAGARPVPVDVSEDSLRFDPALLSAAAAGGRVAAVLAPGTWGADQEFPSLRRLGLPVIDDAAYGAGLRDGATGEPCGMRGDAGTWSFRFKALAAPGGGVLWTREGDAAPPEEPPAPAPLRLFADLAVRGILRHRIPRLLGGAAPPVPWPEPVREGARRPEAGGMAGLQAAVARAQWERREALAATRARIAAVLREGVAAAPSLAEVLPAGAVPVHFLPLVVRAGGEAGREEAMRLRRALHARGIQTETPYPLPGSAADLPRAAALSSRLLLLPAGATLREDEARRVARALAEEAR